MRKIVIFIMLCFLFILPFAAEAAEAAETATIKDIPQKEVYNLILANGVKRGLTIKSSSDHTVIFDDNQPKSIKFSLNWGSGAKLSHLWTFVPMGNDVLVSYEIQIISYPGSIKERTHIASFDNASTYFPAYKEDLQYWAQFSHDALRGLVAYFNGGYRYGFDTKEKKRDYIEVTSVDKDAPAGIAGLMTGDRIIKLNSYVVKNLSYQEVMNLIENEDETFPLSITVRRNDKEITFAMKKQFFPPKYTRE